ncbi:hypothetical protein [Streptomyces chattanoogensis]|uniref:hypothetical protein n=1 Tax=Streptomyces chattanoogensis TaxID=66876 RepID=UPI003674BFB6
MTSQVRWGGGEFMPDSNEEQRLALGYEMAKSLLASQDRTVTNLRTRASGILATAALVVTFSTSIGLLRNDPQKNLLFPRWAAWTLLAVIVVQGFFVMAVLWPVTFSFGHSVINMVDPRQSQAAERPISLRLVGAMMDDIQANSAHIGRMAKALRLAMILLLAEVSVIVIALIALE